MTNGIHGIIKVYIKKSSTFVLFLTKDVGKRHSDNSGHAMDIRGTPKYLPKLLSFVFLDTVECNGYKGKLMVYPLQIPTQ